MTHHLHMTFDYAKEMPLVANRHHILNIDVSYATEDRVTDRVTDPIPECPLFTKICKFLDEKDRQCSVKEEGKILEMSHEPEKKCPMKNIGDAIYKSIVEMAHNPSLICCPVRSHESSTKDKPVTISQAPQENPPQCKKLGEIISECLRICRRAQSTEDSSHTCQYKESIDTICDSFKAFDYLRSIGYPKGQEEWSELISLLQCLIKFILVIPECSGPECSGRECIYSSSLLEIQTIIDGFYREYFCKNDTSTTSQKEVARESDTQESKTGTETSTSTSAETREDVPLPPPIPESRRRKTEVDASPTDFAKIFTDLLGSNNSNLLEGLSYMVGDGKKLRETISKNIDMDGILKSLGDMKDMEGLITQFTRILNQESTPQEKEKSE